MSNLACDIATNSLYLKTVEQCGEIPTCPHTVTKESICNFLPTRPECLEWREAECFCNWRVEDAENLTPCEIAIKEQEEADAAAAAQAAADAAAAAQAAADAAAAAAAAAGNTGSETTDPVEGGASGPGGDMGGKGEGKMMEGMMMAADPMMGQITYTMVAVSAATATAFDLFRYNPASADIWTEWTTAGLTGTNFTKLSRDIGGYAGLAFWSVASLTQILSIFGVAADINVMVWMYGGMVGGLVSLVAHFIAMWAYDQLYVVKTTSATPAEVTAAETLMHEMELAAIAVGSGEVLMGLELYDQGMNWMAAQMMAMGEGKKEKVMEEMMGEDEEMPEDLFRAALNYMF